MRSFITSALLLLAMLLPATVASAHDFEVDGIYYNIINGNEVAVTYEGSYSYPQQSYTGEVTIPASVTYGGSTYTVTSIGHYAFRHCSGLFSVTIPKTVTSISRSAFEYSSDLTSFIVETGNPNYDSRNNCNAIIETSTNTLIIGCQKTIIPNSVTTIGDYAFLQCYGLSSITIPNSVTAINNCAFYNCRGLTSVTIGNSVTSIGENAFNGCSGLTSITIPNSVTSIGGWAFSGCSGLTSITIGNSVTSIGAWMFAWCSSLTSIDIPNSVTTIEDYAFYYCSGLSNVTIGHSITSIGHGAFSHCSGLTSVSIPNSVTIIEGFVFDGCNCLTTVIIPNSVSAIGSGAFCDCNSLANLYCYIVDPSTISMGDNVFSQKSSDYSGRTLHVPHGTADAYQADEHWYPYFGQIVEDLIPNLAGDVNGDLEVNIADVNAVIDIIQGGNGYTTAADVNGDGEVNIADVNAIINIVLQVDLRQCFFT